MPAEPPPPDARFKELTIVGSLSDALNASGAEDAPAGPAAAPLPELLLPKTIGKLKPKPKKEEPPEADSGSPVLIRKGVAAISRRRKKPRSSSSEESAPVVVKRRGASRRVQADVPEIPTPAVVRRRGVGRRKVVAATSAEHAPSEDLSPRELDSAAWVAIEDGKGDNAVEFAKKAWRADPTTARLLTFVAACDETDDFDKLVKHEADRTLSNAVSQSEEMGSSGLLLLLVAGRYSTVAEIVDSMGEYGWSRGDLTAQYFVPFAIRSLLGKNIVPGGSILEKIWQPLEDRNRWRVPTPGDQPPPMGQWLAQALEREPISAGERDRMEEVLNDLVDAAMDADEIDGELSAAEYAVALAELYCANVGSDRAHHYLEHARTVCSRSGQLRRTLDENARASSILRAAR